MSQQSGSSALLTAAGQHAQAGKFDDAEKIYRQVLAKFTDNGSVAVASFQLGQVLERKNRQVEAAESYMRAIKAYPQYIEAHFNLGRIMNSLGKPDTAIKSYENILRINDNLPEVHFNIGVILKEKLQFDAALQSFARACALRPTVETYANIAVILHKKANLGEAMRFYKLALSLQPDHVDTLNNFSALLTQTGQFEEAEILCRKVLSLEPDYKAAINHLGIIYKSSGKLDQAIGQYNRLIEIDPGNVSAHTNRLLAMVYAPFVTPEELAQAARDFGRNIADPLLRRRPFKNDKNPGRKLRIGYVSPDFRDHAVNYFFEHILDRHNRENFETYGYYNNLQEDHITLRLKKKFTHWRNIKGSTDEEAADMIENDRIDILVDLAGHTGNNRLLVFAYKPAPVQVTWLGWPATTGMKAMDYRITDPFAEPEGMTEHLNTETLWRLPDIFCCYGGSDKNPPVIGHPPFEDNEYITFGCFNNFTKVTDDVLAAWAKIMDRVPDSRLLLEITGLDGRKFRTEVEERLQKAGIALDRTILEPRRKENQYVLYNRIDIALDPFPCNGGTTSMDTAWMGVPFVTLEGKHFVSRMGVTILNNIGLPELIARNLDEYIEKAAALAADRERLKKIRHNMRAHVEKSPMMDQEKFVKNMETAYRAMWHKWCEAA